MALEHCTDVSVADWIAHAHAPWETLVNFGPLGFATYARLRFIPDPTEPGQAEADVTVADDHPSDLAQARHALDHLSQFTTTPDLYYFAVWDGRSDYRLPATVLSGPKLSIPHRAYFLLRGSLADLDRWDVDIGGPGYLPPPSFVWPADREWCFASDVDPHWAGIGGSREAIDDLLSAGQLDVVPAQPTERQPTYY